MRNGRKQQQLIILVILTLAVSIVVITAMVMNAKQPPVETLSDDIGQRVALQKALQEAQLEEELLRQERDSIRGQLTDSAGIAVSGVVVSDGVTCALTDSAGRYALHRHRHAGFVYYSVPDYCAIPTHSESDHTACIYQAITDTDSVYNFTLTRLPNGKETRFRMIVLGDPQVTNAQDPYFTGPNDSLISKSNLERFVDETMVDIRKTIATTPNDVPVYGLSMGDNVQYTGGYNDTLQLGMRHVLGSSPMTTFSVIGNHDQEGKRIYQKDWENAWGPTNYSFNRGDVHYVVMNNCDFYHGKLYYSPGELSDIQMAWLTADLSLADKQKRVVLCYHIPFTFGNHPNREAKPLDISTEPGHFLSSRFSHVMALLLDFEGGYELFCGHTHFALKHELQFDDHHIMERCHASAGGTIWQSNINICGTPNGYYIYDFDGTTLTDAHYKGTRWDSGQQMTLFRADQSFNKESYAEDWHLPKNKGIIIANVWNADSRWHLVAMENGVRRPMHRLDSLNQDAFATGYLHRYSKAVTYWYVSSRNSYLIMNHLYYYEPRSPKSLVFIKAIDPYGNTYTASTTDIVTKPYFNFAHYY